MKTWKIITGLIILGILTINYVNSLDIPIVGTGSVNGKITSINTDENYLTFESGSTVFEYSNCKGKNYTLNGTEQFQFQTDQNLVERLIYYKDQPFNLKLTFNYGIINNVVPEWVDIYQIVEDYCGDEN